VRILPQKWSFAVRIDMHELRTVIMNGWHSYEMDAAVKMLRHESPFDWID